MLLEKWTKIIHDSIYILPNLKPSIFFIFYTIIFKF